MQNVVAVIVLVSILWAFERRLISRPRRLTFNRDALLILSMIGGVVATELFAQVVPVRPLRRRAGRVRGGRARRPAPGRRSARRPRGGFVVLWWAHIALVAAFLVYLPFSKHLHIATALPEHLVPQARAARRAAGDGPRARGRDVRPEVAPGPRLEGPARRLHLHRVRPLPGGLPGRTHRASRSTPRHSSWASGTCRSRPSTGST